MKRSIIPAVSTAALLFTGSFALGQTATGSTNDATGLGSGVTSTPTTSLDGTTSTATAGNTGTGVTTTGSSSTLTPFNSAQNATSYNNMKTQVRTFQNAGSSTNTATATAATTSDFNSVFLVPFITNFFTQFTAFLVQQFANTTTGNAVPSGSTPA